MVLYYFRTTDTNESIPINCDNTFRVHLIDNLGNKWTECNYDGCGFFGNKNIFELIANMNNKYTQEDGVKLFINRNTNTIFPNIIRYYDDSTEWINVSLATHYDTISCWNNDDY